MKRHGLIHAPAPGDRPSERGIALIIVMISVTVLAILASGFAWSMKVETRLARNANSEAQLEWLGRSGVEYARWILAEQMKIAPEPYDGLNQVWAGGMGGIGTSNTALVDVQKEVKLGTGSFTWKIYDLERKANINTASEVFLQQTLTLMGVDAGEMPPVVGSILDWIDTDDSTHMQGAESDYYQTLDPPYFAKNGPVDDLSELLLIKGVTPEMYWGMASTNHPPAAFLQKNHRFRGAMQASTITSGLADLFTPISSGKININTASADVLQLIPGMDRVMADALVAGRQGEDDGTGLVGPYRNLQEVRRVPEVSLGLGNQLGQYCDVRSRTFEVHIDAKVGNYQREFVAILARNTPRDIQILSFYWK
jgi:general secretion pathway protein K